MISTCDRHIGRRYLATGLSATEEQSFVAHLDQCDRCREWLEHDAGDRGSWLEAQATLSKSGEVTATQPVSDSSSRQAAIEMALSLLSPTDDPAMLGRIGAYEVSGVVGQGGMGIVFKAVDRTLARVVALKVIDPMLAKVGAARKRFAREARAMAAVSHQNVVPIFAVEEAASLPFFVMEYVPGRSLGKRIAEEGPLDAEKAVTIALQVARALAAAHRQGLIHRDIKPDNILLSPGLERVLVTDFGLARVVDDASMTQSGMISGTPQYMSPEQIRGEAAGPSSDLFSLGAVMYAALTGHPPFRADTVYGVMQRTVNDAPRPIREASSATPAWLEAFVLRLLAKSPECRFESAEEVAQLLERELAYLQNPMAADRPPRAWRRRPEWLAIGRRRRVIVGLSLAMIVASAAAAIAVWPDSPPATGHTQTANNIAAIDAGDSNSRSSDAGAPLGRRPPTEAFNPDVAWSSDATDTEALLRQAHRLEAELYTSPNQTTTDAWRTGVAEIRAGLQRLDNEDLWQD